MREWQAGRAGRYDLDGLITALDGVPRTVIRAVRACVVQRILLHAPRGRRHPLDDERERIIDLIACK